MSKKELWTIARWRATVMFGVVSVAGSAAGQTQDLHFYQLGGTQLNIDQAQVIARQFDLSQGKDPNGGALPVWLMGDGSVRQSFIGGVLYMNPDLPNERKKAPELPAVQRYAENFLGDNKLRPDDRSQWQVGEFNPWSRQAAVPDKPGGSIITPIVNVRFQRMLEKLPCIGPSSILSVNVDAAGPAGVLASVRPVSLMEDKVEPKSLDQINAEFLMDLDIVKKLNPGTVQVQSKRLCYFEQGLRFVQPVWQFNVLITGKAGDKTLDEIIVPVALNSPEPVQYGNFSGQPPVIPSSANTRSFTSHINNVRLGEYVVREDADQGICLNVANAFWVNSLFGAVGIGKMVSRTQYYWDHQWLWEDALGIPDQSRYYPGAVDFGVVVSHGAPWQFSSLSNYGEWTDLHNMNHFGANSGAGNPDQDYTSYLLYTACSMMPAPGDPYGGTYTSGSPFDVWWNMFWGMHGVYGFRTTAGKQACVDGFGAFGHAVGAGHPNLAAWLDATSALNHGGNNNYGTIVLATGYENDTIYNTTARKKATSLTMWWNHS